MFKSTTVVKTFLQLADPSYVPTGDNETAVPISFIEAMHPEIKKFANLVSEIGIINTFLLGCSAELKTRYSNNNRRQIYRKLRRHRAGGIFEIILLETENPVRHSPFNATTPKLKALNTFLEEMTKFQRVEDAESDLLEFNKDRTWYQQEKLGQQVFNSAEHELNWHVSLLLAKTSKTSTVEDTLVYQCLQDILFLLWHSPDVPESKSNLWVQSITPYLKLRDTALKLNMAFLTDAD